MSAFQRFGLAAIAVCVALGFTHHSQAQYPGAPGPYGLPGQGPQPMMGPHPMMMQAAYANPYAQGQMGPAPVGLPASANFSEHYDGQPGPGPGNCSNCEPGCDCPQWDSCGDCDRGPGCHFYAGGGVYFLVPHWKTNPAYQVTQAVGGVASSTQTDFSYDLDVAPLVWAGVRGSSGFGLLARGWWYDDSEELTLVGPGGGVAINSAAPLGLRNTSTTAGDVNTYFSALDLGVIDGLATFRHQKGRGALEVGAGARYGRIRQQYNHTETPGSTLLLDTILSDHEFEGVGPLLTIDCRAALTSNFRLFATLRYAILFGSARQSAVSIADNVLVATRNQQNRDVLPITEMELGAEYGVMCGRCQWFTQCAFVAQLWEGAGNSANNDLIPVMVDPEVSDKNADMGLYGLKVTTGFRF